MVTCVTSHVDLIIKYVMKKHTILNYHLIYLEATINGQDHKETFPK